MNAEMFAELVKLMAGLTEDKQKTLTEVVNLPGDKLDRVCDYINGFVACMHAK